MYHLLKYYDGSPVASVQPPHHMKNSTKNLTAILGSLLIAILVAGAMVNFKSPARPGDATVSGITSSSATLTLPAKPTPAYQVLDGKNWNPATGKITWGPAAAEIKP